MGIMNYRSDEDRGETFIRSADFLDDCDDALRAIEAAKIRAEDEITKALVRLRDVCDREANRVVSNGSEDTEIRAERTWKSTINMIEDILIELTFDTEREIRSEMGG